MTIKHIYPWIAITNVSGFICIIVFRRHDPGFLSFPVCHMCYPKKKKKEFWAIKGDPLSQQSPECCANIEFLSWLLKAFKRSEDEIRLGVREESWLQILQRLQTKQKGQRVQQIGTKAMTLTLTWQSCVCVCVCVCVWAAGRWCSTQPLLYCTVWPVPQLKRARCRLIFSTCWPLGQDLIRPAD